MGKTIRMLSSVAEKHLIQANRISKKKQLSFGIVSVYLFMAAGSLSGADSETTALWLFDEQAGLYPSSVLSDSSDNDYPMVIGPGGRIVEGKFGQALEPLEQPPVDYPRGEKEFGLTRMRVPKGRTVEPMTWRNANFCALMTSGENHLRKEVGFANASKTDLNLGAFDWTVEFWYRPTRNAGEEGVVFEVGKGPRGENEKATRLILNPDRKGFSFFNGGSGPTLFIPSEERALDPENGKWHHLAFVYSEKENQLRHYVDGREQPLPEKNALQSLEAGEEAYFTVGRDGRWKRPLPGRIDELRFSRGAVYGGEFKPPNSFSPFYKESYQSPTLKKGLPLLFGDHAENNAPLDLGTRKHLFIDDAIVEKMESLAFTVNPPRLAERVIDHIEGPYRKHLRILEDEDGLLRLYNSVNDDYLQVVTSRDGVHWEKPDLGRGEYKGHRNIVIPEPVGGLGSVFIDPNAPPEEKWRYVSGFHKRGIFAYASSDGWSFRRFKTAVLPFRSGTQSNLFYDEQRRLYVGYHRSGFARTPAGSTQREEIMTETRDLLKPWPYAPVSPEASLEAAKTRRLRKPNPWYLDNGPLTPGGFGLEFPNVFAPIDSMDPPGTDIYVAKALKYRWAPDTYLAFPTIYFHYVKDGPITRQILIDPRRGRGSGPIETQLAVSRDGIHWKRRPRPAYVGNGMHSGRDIHQAYMADGMIRRGDEIWQYYFGTEIYHSTWSDDQSANAVYRVIQRLDGFVSVDSPYDHSGTLKTKPLRFQGNRLVLNIDTNATGYAQVGFLDESGEAIPGFSLDDCIYINGDFTAAEAEWKEMGTDLSSLAGKTVHLVFRMRGSKLYAMQFVER